VDSIDPQAKIPPPDPEKTMITRKTDDRDPQGERPGLRRQKKTSTPTTASPEEEKPEKQPGIDILV
jgi:hypothetical protein